MQSYDTSTFENVDNFRVPTCPIFTGPVTFQLLLYEPATQTFSNAVKPFIHQNCLSKKYFDMGKNK